MSATPHDLLNVIAGEYVLGLLTEAERADVDARLAHDAALRAAVKRAADRFHELDLTADAGPAPALLWDRIAAQLDAPPAATNVVKLLPKLARGKFWQGFGAASLAASLLAAVVAVPIWNKFGTPVVIVVLLDGQSNPGAIIEAFNDDSVRVVPLETFAVPDGRVIQLWTLPDAKTGPVSLGLLPNLRERVLTGPSLPRPKPDQLYEFTLEPAGGSPTGRPTGPILVKGFAKTPI